MTDNQLWYDLHRFLISHLTGTIIVIALVAVFVFPVVAALVAPSDRRAEFFILTLLFLPGPLGVACASIAQSRD
jgi:hypothetical protein